MNEKDLKKLELKLADLQSEIEEIKRILAENEQLYAEIHEKLEEMKNDNL